MTFPEWLAQYQEHDTPRGDLARDVERDRTFPGDAPATEEGLARIQGHVAARGACMEARGTLRRALASWAKAERHRLSVRAAPAGGGES